MRGSPKAFYRAAALFSPVAFLEGSAIFLTAYPLFYGFDSWVNGRPVAWVGTAVGVAVVVI